MSFIADYNLNYKTWDFIIGNHYDNLSIASDRFFYLQDLNYKEKIITSLRDPNSKKWTKHVEFPGQLWEIRYDKFRKINYSGISAAIDVHRSMLKNEIIIESDYETYKENYDAIKIIGEIIEVKGFSPLYYYSGNKSIHIHLFFNWNCLKKLDVNTQDKLRIIFKDSKSRFKISFMKWLREKMISCWNTNAKKFDTDLIRQNHLIRCELSRNKKGYKTFLGYTYKDACSIPYICNEDNRIYPKLGKIKLSSPKDIQKLIEEFIEDIELKDKEYKISRRNNNLNKWINNPMEKSMRECVKIILSDNFKKVNDGYQRAMFILLNELKRIYSKSESEIIIKDWNVKMGNPINEDEINYRLKLKNYSLSCNYIHKFLSEVGIDMLKKCNGKVYK
ncbi:MAG TPA: hypothetical protein ENI61_05795 [Ignavibacteria bacterium]|nr:hypothetical protein [Ignavibacteria bacterium]